VSATCRFSCSLYYANTSFFQAELLGNVARITDETGEQLRTVVMAMKCATLRLGHARGNWWGEGWGRADIFAISVGTPWFRWMFIV
jgi:hypothetical protein